LRDLDARFFRASRRDPPEGKELITQMRRWVNKLGDMPEAEVTAFIDKAPVDQDPSNVPTQAEVEEASERTMQDRPEWKQKQMRMAYELGWRATAPRDEDEEIKAIRARITGWVPPAGARHWCSQCADRYWCKNVNRACGKENYHPRGSKFQATPESMLWLSDDTIYDLFMHAATTRPPPQVWSDITWRLDETATGIETFMNLRKPITKLEQDARTFIAENLEQFRRHLQKKMRNEETRNFVTAFMNGE
jgi:hypothetical protein